MAFRSVFLVFLCLVAISVSGCDEAKYAVGYTAHSARQAREENRRMKEAWNSFPERYRDLCAAAYLEKKPARVGGWVDAPLLPGGERYKNLAQLLREYPLQDGDERNKKVLDCLAWFAGDASSVAERGTKAESALWLQIFVTDTASFLEDAARSPVSNRIAGTIMTGAILGRGTSGNAIWKRAGEKELREQAADLLVYAIEAAWQDTEKRFAAYTMALQMTTLPEKRAALYAKGKPVMQAEMQQSASSGDMAVRWLVKWAPDQEEKLARFREFVALYTEYAGWELAQEITPEFSDSKTQQYVVFNLTRHSGYNEGDQEGLPIRKRGLFYYLYYMTGNEYWLDASFPKLLELMPALAPHRDYFLSETLLMRGKYAEGLKRREAYLLSHYEDQYASGAKPETRFYERSASRYIPICTVYKSKFYWQGKVLYYKYRLGDEWQLTHANNPSNVLADFEKAALRCFADDRKSGPPTARERECVAKIVPAMELREHILPKD